MAYNNAEEVFGVVNKPVVEEVFAVDNIFIRQLVALSRQYAQQAKGVTFVLRNNASNRGETGARGIRADDKSMLDICKLTPLTTAFESRTLADEIAQYRLSMIGLGHEPYANWKGLQGTLVADYLLASCLCFVETFDGDYVTKGFYTRNRELAGQLTGKSIDDMKKYAPYLQMSPANYQTGALRGLKINVTKKGFTVTQPRSYIDMTKTVKITPLFLMSTLYEGLSSLLGRHIIKFTYVKNNLTEREFVTTLAPHVLNTFYPNDFVQLMITKVSTNFDKGYVHLPELGISKYDKSGVRALNLSRITSIELVDISKVDTSYIDVDFDRILPSFRETIMHSNDVNFLTMVHEELLNAPVSVNTLIELKTVIVSYIESQYTIGTTTALRHLHKYMVSREKFFPLYRGGQPLTYGKSPNFNLGGAE